MDKAEILKQINRVFIDVLDDENIILNYDTIADDVEDWDSLTHVQLVVAVERHFKMRFTAKEIQSWKNIGEMVDSISEKI